MVLNDVWGHGERTATILTNYILSRNLPKNSLNTSFFDLVFCIWLKIRLFTCSRYVSLSYIYIYICVYADQKIKPNCIETKYKACKQTRNKQREREIERKKRRTESHRRLSMVSNWERFCTFSVSLLLYLLYKIPYLKVMRLTNIAEWKRHTRQPKHWTKRPTMNL